MSHDPLGGSNDPLTEIAYQISFKADINIMIYTAKLQL